MHVVSSKEYIKGFSKHLFWDADLNELDMDKHSAYVIPRVLEYGDMDDWRLLNKYYSLNKIVEVCKSVRFLDPMCLTFICAISHTNEKEYRCYHYRQSFPTLWNS